MKKLLLLLILTLLSCNRKNTELKALQSRIDSLEAKLATTYKPGFGEFMSNIQVHHAKLWFAGQNQNWALADFEIHEIMENVEDIQKFETDRKESEVIEMIEPALDSVNAAIQKKDPEQFAQRYYILTKTCNKCHQDVDFGFNVIKVPDMQTFSNQDFRPGN
ncbi:MAG: hypothetical protein KDC69_00610 [Flavobacteriaceae bacterium]|nr:hypothetical protein [Flavobacteriaceae bacterium]